MHCIALGTFGARARFGESIKDARSLEFAQELCAYDSDSQFKNTDKKQSLKLGICTMMLHTSLYQRPTSSKRQAPTATSHTHACVWEVHGRHHCWAIATMPWE